MDGCGSKGQKDRIDKVFLEVPLRINGSQLSGYLPFFALLDGQGCDNICPELPIFSSNLTFSKALVPITNGQFGSVASRREVNYHSFLFDPAELLLASTSEQVMPVTFVVIPDDTNNKLFSAGIYT